MTGPTAAPTPAPRPRRPAADAPACPPLGRRQRALGGIAILVVAALLAACGVREDEEPRVLSNDVVPAELSEPAPASTMTGDASALQRLYIIETRGGTEEFLVPYLAPMDRGPGGDDFHRRVIEELVTFRPPENAPYTTAIPPTTGVIDVRLVAGPDGEQDVLEINLNSLEVSGGARLKLAIAQMVFTATGIPGVRGVRFLINNTAVAVPLDVGESETGAIVTRADFPQLNPTTTTTTTAAPADPVPGDLGIDETTG